MKSIAHLCILGIFLVTAAGAHAQISPPRPKVGDTYEITLVRESSEKGSEGSSGTSHDQDKIVERVIGVRADGLELEYDLPNSASAEDRAGSWQFPARIFKPFGGSPQLLNRAELEVRVDKWLKAASWSRNVCGHWIFTWNAFRIECDPQSVIETIKAFDLRSADVRDGAAYQDPDARGLVRLTKKTAGSSGATFTGDMDIDPDVVRRAGAENDVAVGEITGKPMTLEAALRDWAKAEISGKISITLETNPDGDVWRRTKVINLATKKPNGSSESRTTTETLERRLVPQRRP